MCLENLFKYESVSNWEHIVNCDSMTAQILIVGNTMIQILSYAFNKTIGRTRLKFPKSFSRTPFVAVTDNDNSLAILHLQFAVGWNTSEYVDVNNLNGGFTMLVIGKYN